MKFSTDNPRKRCRQLRKYEQMVVMWVNALAELQGGKFRKQKKRKREQGAGHVDAQQWGHVQERNLLRESRVRAEQLNAQQTSGHHEFCHFSGIHLISAIPDADSSCTTFNRLNLLYSRLKKINTYICLWKLHTSKLTALWNWISYHRHDRHPTGLVNEEHGSDGSFLFRRPCIYKMS